MKERSLIAKPWEVRPFLEGRKTRLRRVVKLPSHIKHHELDLTRMQDGYPDGVRPIWGDDNEPNLFSTRNPYGQPGDRLWVKETYMPDPPRDGTWCSVAWEDDMRLDEIPERYRIAKHVIHRASWGGVETVGWKPSIHMPRWASRITLEIVSVRVERLNEITEEDAKAEGLDIVSDGGARCGIMGLPESWSDDPRVSYQALWESINGPGSWDANPYVWVIEFRRVEK